METLADYERGYSLGNDMVNSKEDTNFMNALLALPDEKMVGTIRDRLADAFISGVEAERAKTNELRGRVIELECALKWWLEEKMKLFDERQYGKAKLRNILENGSLPIQTGKED